MSDYSVETHGRASLHWGFDFMFLLKTFKIIPNYQMSISKRVKSFKYAFKGIFTMLKTQQNTWIHAVVTMLILFLGFYFKISNNEWCWIILAMMAVWTAEALNTAIEFLADAVSSKHHPLIGKAKDVAAGAVLISAIGSAIIGLLIFLPSELFNSGKFS